MFEHDKLEIHQREQQGITILDLKGHLVMGAADTELREKVQGLLDGGNRQLILNLGGLTDVDTSGAGALLFLAAEYRAAGGKMVLIQLDHAHGELYETARLESSIENCREEIDAVNSFFPDRAIQHYDILDFVEQRQHETEPEKNK
jgi:anti-sigma B factor antagonist